jgi:HAD superfamily phosphatase (TIGR01668 family)
MSRWHADTLADGVTAIDVAELLARGVSGAIIDLDNTLVSYRSLQPTEEAAAWVKAALASGLKMVLVTNNSTPWARLVADTLAIPCIPNARKPLPGGFHRALETLGLPRDRVVVIGDQYFTDVLGAKLFGMHVILVPPLGGRDPWNTRPLRILARLLRFEHRSRR